MANGKFVAYFRVSSRKQGKSGLGLEAQRESVQVHLNGGRWKMVGEFVEVESGKRKDRPKLAEALSLCRAYGATLIIAKLDRLARNVAFISALMEAGVEFLAVDMPSASKFTVHIMAAVAEQEADMIAERTRKALATARARGTHLGRRDDAIALYAETGNQASAEVRAKTAQKRANDLRPVIAKAKKEGANSLRQVADKLNEWGTPTVSKRGGQWSAVQVQRVLVRTAS
jgi:DNA invertase Pin-like site-specific DNA recombinase